MPKKAKDLTAIEVKRLIKAGRHAVGTISGLLLVVKDTGAKSWMIRTMVGNKRKSIGLGAYPEVTLSIAHEKARVAKGFIEKGIDPIAEKLARRAALKKKSMQTISFSEAALQCHKKKA
ncbi:MAG: Arm DNA-binding domain-containing protein, partial [Proteobacteria bacterium]|nr:Arm DNA-binding domain-containing protein [Pseudomonadota bacterium]